MARREEGSRAPFTCFPRCFCAGNNGRPSHNAAQSRDEPRERICIGVSSPRRLLPRNDDLLSGCGDQRDRSRASNGSIRVIESLATPRRGEDSSRRRLEDRVEPERSNLTSDLDCDKCRSMREVRKGSVASRGRFGIEIRASIWATRRDFRDC